MNRFTASTKLNLKTEPLYVVILCGGFGYREKTKKSKFLSEIDGQKLIDLQIKSVFNSFPKAYVTLTVGFQADKLIKGRNAPVNFIENQLWENTNTLEELRLYFNSCNPHRLILVDGHTNFKDIWIKQLEPNTIIWSEEQSELGITMTNDVVEHFSYGLTNYWSGLAMLEGKSLEELKKFCTREHNRFYLFEALNNLINKNFIINGIKGKN